MTNTYYWLLESSRIAITTVLDPELKAEDVKPHPTAVLLHPSSVPTDLSTSYKWVYNSYTREIYVDPGVEKREQWEAIRLKRNNLLAQSDVLLVREIEAGRDTEYLKVYRQALRDITTEENPNHITWPSL